MILSDTVEIKAKPSEVYSWFLNFTENYCSWHPDHIKAEWTSGKPFETGSILCAEEILHGKLHKIQFCLTKIEPNRLIEYRNLFPFSLLSPQGSFKFYLKGQNTLFTATLTFRMGRFLAPFFQKNVNLFIKHLKEEGENLKNIRRKVGGRTRTNLEKYVVSHPKYLLFTAPEKSFYIHHSCFD